MINGAKMYMKINSRKKPMMKPKYTCAGVCALQYNLAAAIMPEANAILAIAGMELKLKTKAIP